METAIRVLLCADLFARSVTGCEHTGPAGPGGSGPGVTAAERKPKPTHVPPL